MEAENYAQARDAAESACGKRGAAALIFDTSPLAMLVVDARRQIVQAKGARRDIPLPARKTDRATVETSYPHAFAPAIRTCLNFSASETRHGEGRDLHASEPMGRSFLAK